ncbi:trimethylamine methyltransferase family protein [Tropicibacter sp. R16_0]|uniref:trimethylamine methyltransferase family protein n=1 Tax=Tropicibacter sp. R16_0 TaxID=2821102 RepID=UPI001ADB646C|nr:trimethylamine methyltransferase family protein [Tropicibacter sp. R16_0]MBO9449061.1 trimethylamine methyltransferase family protein [Tropicibacter sp. R16_0]
MPRVKGRSGRAARIQSQKAVRTRLAPVTRRLKPLDVLDADAIERIHDASLSILEEVGIDFRDPIALTHWRQAGADVSRDRVRIDRALLMDLVAKAPSEFRVQGRGAATGFTMGGDTSVFCPMKGAPFTRDLNGVRRSTTEADVINFARLTQACPSFHMAGGFTCEAMDIPVAHRHLAMMRHHMVETELPLFGIGTSRERAEDCVSMARIVAGDVMESATSIFMHASGNSPLVWDEAMLDGARVFADAGQAVLCSPFVLAAANTPADVAATIAQVNAEALAAIAYLQLYRPGTPVMYGQYTVSISMQSGAPMAGTPEVALITTAIGQLARKYGVPWRTSANHASSKSFDAQSGYEGATTLMTAFNAGANLMLHAAGWDEGGLAICYGKFVADDEQNQLMARYAGGISLDRFDEALEAVGRIGPAGHYLGDSFTLDHFRSAFAMPELMDFSSFEQWSSAGNHDMAARSRAKACLLLQDFEAPHMDAAIREELDAYVERRQSEIDPGFS